MTASACINGTITNPPPYDRAPTLNPTQATAAKPPAATDIPTGATIRAAHVSPIDTSPQITITATTHGPTTADATAPATV